MKFFFFAIKFSLEEKFQVGENSQEIPWNKSIESTRLLYFPTMEISNESSQTLP
jgi:hypothetical protein